MSLDNIDTQALRDLSALVQRGIANGPWPPDMMYLWMLAALRAWRSEGEFFYRLRDDRYPPALTPDLPLATALLRRSAVCYVSRRKWWMILARMPKGHVTRIAHGREAETPAPSLIWATIGPDGYYQPGAFDLSATPTPRQLRIEAGLDDATRAPCTQDSLSVPGIRLAQCLPWFYAQK